jgi:hypothetical protein
MTSIPPYVAARIAAERGQTLPPTKTPMCRSSGAPPTAARRGRSIVNGLPKDERTGSWVNSLRVDPEQPGLLFAGSETTVYVSFDNGDHWQSLRQNLPSTSIRDLDLHTDHHQNDLVIGTYGRGFWVLDDITPLRQIAANAQSHQLFSVSISSSPRRPFAPASTATGISPSPSKCPTRPMCRMARSWIITSATNPGGPIQLQVFDTQGNLVRTMTSTLPPPIEGADYPYYWLAAPESRALSHACRSEPRQLEPAV